MTEEYAYEVILDEGESPNIDFITHDANNLYPDQIKKPLFHSVVNDKTEEELNMTEWAYNGKGDISGGKTNIYGKGSPTSIKDTSKENAFLPDDTTEPLFSYIVDLDNSGVDINREYSDKEQRLKSLSEKEMLSMATPGPINLDVKSFSELISDSFLNIMDDILNYDSSKKTILEFLYDTFTKEDRLVFVATIVIVIVVFIILLNNARSQ